MVIARGMRLVRIERNGPHDVVQVKAIRQSPVPYAEVESAGSGQRAAVLLTELEREYRLESDTTTTDLIEMIG